MPTTSGQGNRGPGRSGSGSGARTRPASGGSSRNQAGTRPGTGAPVRPATPGSGRRPPQVWRLVTLMVLVGFLAMFLAPTLRGYMDQRAEISRARAVVADEERRIAELQAELAAWEDPVYIEQQARERLRYVREGEVVFTVLDDLETEVADGLPGMAPVTVDIHENRPWYGEVWESVRVANEGLPEGTGGN